VFDAAAPNGPASALKFSPVAKCPAYEVPQEIATPVRDKQRRDDEQVAQLISRGTPTVPVRTGTDGGMNPVFMAAVVANGGTDTRIEARSIPGSIPANIRPPGPANPGSSPVMGETTGSTMSLASTESRPAPAPRAATQTTAAGGSGGLFGGLFSSSGDDGAKNADKSADKSSESGGVFDKMSRLVGLHGSDPAADTAATAKTKPAPAKTQTASAAPGAIRPKPQVQPQVQPQTPAQPDPKVATASASKPQATPQQPGDQPQPTDTASNGNLLRGAQATVPAGSFDTRWGAMH